MDSAKNFINEYLDWIKNNSSQISIGDYNEITTPFVDAHNDHIRFYMKQMHF